ncbi:MAG TPA: hypothetical protein VJL56_04265 [Candidatus Bathyarchaeia archaeon]|nr:hypothetical protein [Candidatus Bathyarchaeia archaeon]
MATKNIEATTSHYSLQPSNHPNLSIMVQCKHCNGFNLPGTSICRHCGTKLS